MKNTYNLYLKNKQNKLVSASENPFKTESELEEYIMKTPEIFSDIFIIKRQIKAGKDIPDMIGIDRDNNIVIIENKNIPVTEDILQQIIRYAFWAETHPDSIKALWLEKEDRPDIDIDWDNVEIRVIVVAPYIKSIVLKLLRNVNYKVELIEVKRFLLRKQECILVNKLEDDEEKNQKVTKGLSIYDKTYLKKYRNNKSVDQYFEVANQIEKINRQLKMDLERKNNKFYIGFKLGFFNIFGINWIGTKSFQFFFKISKKDFNKLKRLSPYKLEYEERWKQANLKWSENIDVKRLTKVLEKVYELFINR